MPHRLANFLLCYRSTPHSTTGVSPASLFLGREVRTRFDLLKPDINKRVYEKQSQQKTDHDNHVRVRTFTVSEQVMVKNFRPGPLWFPGTITQQHGPLSFTVCTESGQHWQRHVDHMKHLGEQSESRPTNLPQNDDTFTEMPTITSDASANTSSSTSPVESTTETSQPRYPR